jgi:hypothetical protein
MGDGCVRSEVMGDLLCKDLSDWVFVLGAKWSVVDCKEISDG